MVGEAGLALCAWLSGAACMWLWIDYRRLDPRRCACGRYPIESLSVEWLRDRSVEHTLHRCQPHRESL